MVAQFLIALFGLTAVYCATGNSVRLRKWAPIIGLTGQPAWAWFAWQSQGWGLGLLVMAYSTVYIRGILVQWRKAHD